MALSTTQVQQVFLAITGRPAEGQAVAWGANSLNIAALANSVIDIRKGADFANNKDTFIENLYQNLLGRASDAEGKEFWLKVLNDGASYGDVVAQFINAVLVQSQTADLYTLENKLGIAEQISTQVNTFQGGAAAEATLKSLMKDVNANTTIDSIQDSVDNFVGNSVNIKTVTINPADTDPAKIEGSAENATVFNLSLDVASDNPSMQQELKGSTKFADTLNVKVTSSDKETASTLTDIGTISNIQTLNITTDATIETTNLTIPAGVKNLTITGKSNDTVNVTAAMTSLNTGGGNDTITVGAAANVKAGAGNDQINITVAGKKISIDGGAGRDTVTLNGDNTKVTLTDVEVLTTSAAATVSKTLLDGKEYELNATHNITVSAKNGIDLSNITAADENSSAFTISDVTSGTVKLSAAEEDIKETITLGANANKVTITNFDAETLTAAGGDTLNFKAAVGNTNYNGTGGGGTKIADAPGGGLVTATAVRLDLNGKNGADVVANVEKQTTGSIIAALGGAAAGGKFTAANDKSAIVFVTNTGDADEKTSIYLVKSGAANSNIEDIKLLATVNADADTATWTVANSVLTLA